MNRPLVETPIAIVGMACRLPGADNLDEYWQLLRDGKNAIGQLPRDRLDRDLYYDPAKGTRGKTYSTLGGVIRERPLDLQMCPLDPNELDRWDPCHLIFAEVAAAACVHAGYSPREMPIRNAGVYVGHSGGSRLSGDLLFSTLAEETLDHLRDLPGFSQLPSEIQETVLADAAARIRATRPKRDSSGGPEIEANAVARLVAQTLGLSGPQLVIDAACASSLVALAMGALALQSGQVDLALVGGASYNKVDSLILFSQAQSCSATGSYPFDERADGLISSEGYVALVLKTLGRALADGDTVHAVLRGLGISSDGRGRSLWAPRAEGQTEAIRRAYGPSLEQGVVQYLEAHATSTKVGDATEMETLGELLGCKPSAPAPAPTQGTDKPILPAWKRGLRIGSVKSNIGHTLETAGLASLLKTVLAMQHGFVPPTINLTEPSHSIAWDQFPSSVVRGLESWAVPEGGPRRAGINAFGIGGLNVHAVVEQYVQAETKSSSELRSNVAEVSSESTHSADGSSPGGHTAAARPAGKTSSNPGEAVAIIGRGVVLPGARSVAELERLIHSGRSMISQAPADRWRPGVGVRPGAAVPWHSPTNRGGFIRDYVYASPRRRVPPKQLAQANPLQFMLLDAADQALAEAGLDQRDYDHAHTSVVVGTIFGGEFGSALQVGTRLPELTRELQEVLIDRAGLSPAAASELCDQFRQLYLQRRPALLDETGSFTSSTLASRITKELNLSGGAMAIDSGDCSSFAALDTACQLLLSGVSSLVLCAGAQRAMDLPTYETLALLGWLLDDQQGPLTGCLPGEGVAMLLLKRLSDARRDGDRVLGVVSRVAAAFDPEPSRAVELAGHRLCTGDAPHSAPAVDPAPAVLRTRSGVAELDAAEEHGLEAVFGAPPVAARDVPLIQQLGHTKAAHGLVSVICATLPAATQDVEPRTGAARQPLVLASHNGKGLAYQVQLQYDEAQRPPGASNPALHSSLAQSPSYDGPRNPAQSANQSSATSVRSTYQEPSPRVHATATPARQRPQIWRLGAPTSAELMAQLERSVAAPGSGILSSERPFTTSDRWRAAVVAADPQSAVERLVRVQSVARGIGVSRNASRTGEPLAAEGVFWREVPATRPRVAFLFPGQGAQYPGMLRELVEANPAARAALAEADAVLHRLGYENFAACAWANSDRLGTDIWITQSAVLLADLLAHATVLDVGLRADIVSGHSFGEYAALVAARVWTLDVAMRASRARADAILWSPSPQGTLLSIHTEPHAVAALLGQGSHRVFLTHHNAPQQTVVGGYRNDVLAFMEWLQREGIRSQLLPVPAAYHTPLQEAAQEPLRRALANLQFQPPVTTVASNVTNRYVSEPDELRENLVRQLVAPVRYADLIQRLVADGVGVLVEVGPGQVLTRLHGQILRDSRVDCLATDARHLSSTEALLHIQALGECLGLIEPSQGGEGARTVASSAWVSGPARSEPARSEPARFEPARFEPAIESFDATSPRRQRRRHEAGAGDNGSSHAAARPAIPTHSESMDAGSNRSGNEEWIARSSTAAVTAQVSPVTRSDAARTGARNQEREPKESRKAAEEPRATKEGPGGSELARFLIDFVVEHTGFSADAINLDWDLEADLGIDSIKLAQLFGELRELFPLDESRLQLDQFRTLRQILDKLTDPVAAAQVRDEPPRPHFAGTEVRQFLVDFIVEHTGYPPELVELDADFEADLGIDSIKQAQLLGELQQQFPLPIDMKQRTNLARFRTLRDVLALVPGSMEPSPDVEPVSRSGIRELATTNPSDTALPENAQRAPYGSVADSTAGNSSQGDSPPSVHPDVERCGDRPGNDEAMHELLLSRNLDADTARSQGERHASRIRSLLRRWCDRAPADDMDDNHASEPDSAVERDAVRALAAGAGVDARSLFAYRAAHANGQAPSRAPSQTGASPPADATPAEPQSVDYRYNIQIHTSPERSPEATSRYVLRLQPATQREGAPSVPSLSGDAVILGDNELASALADRLRQLGVRAHVVASDRDPARSVAALEAIWKQAPTPHLFLVTPRDPDARTTWDPRAWAERRGPGLMTPYWFCQRWIALVQKAGLMDSASIVAALSLGGSFGFDGHVAAAESGGVAGLLKSIVIESWVSGFRTLPIKLVDTPADEPSSQIADAMLRELAVPSYDIETSWIAGQRRVVRAIPQVASLSGKPEVTLSGKPAGMPTSQPITPGGTWVCTGGARGITAYVARELALRYGLRLHLIGTAPVPEIPATWRGLTEEGRKKLKMRIMSAARPSGRKPVEAWQDAEKAIEIDATLGEFAKLGIAARYYSCDASDARALGEVLERIRQADGPIRGVLHGAGYGRDARFDRKMPEKVDRCLRAKIDGTLALMRLTRQDPLECFVGFGSISGRFGANGHTDYSAANDMLAKLIGWYRDQRPDVAALAFHWHAWGDVGMATKPETQLALEMVGMQFMPAAEGLQHLIRELESGAPEREVLITDERYYRLFYPAETLVLPTSDGPFASDGPSAPGLIARARGLNAPTTDAKAPTHTGYPLLDGGRTEEQADKSCTTLALDPKVEPFLIEHRLEDRPLLPLVIGIELLAEAGSRWLGERVRVLHNIKADRGLRFFGDAAQTVRVLARRSAGGVACQLNGDFANRNGQVVDSNRQYMSCVVSPEDPALERNRPTLTRGSRSWRSVDYPPRGSKFYLGPPLQRLRRIEIHEGFAVGQVLAPSLVELSGPHRSVLGWLIPSAALDACLYATGSLAWSQIEPGTALPVGIRTLRLGRMPEPGEACIVETRLRCREPGFADFDFTLWGDNGDTILEADQYRIAWLLT